MRRCAMPMARCVGRTRERIRPRQLAGINSGDGIGMSGNGSFWARRMFMVWNVWAAIKKQTEKKEGMARRVKRFTHFSNLRTIFRPAGGITTRGALGDCLRADWERNR